MSESGPRLAGLLQMKTSAMILSMLAYRLAAVSLLSSSIHLELFTISLAMCLHQASLLQQLNSHLSALAS